MRRFVSRVHENEETSAIDVTPMLDVVFILLIFFIVTATFVKETGVDVNRPEATTASTSIMSVRAPRPVSRKATPGRR